MIQNKALNNVSICAVRALLWYHYNSLFRNGNVFGLFLVKAVEKSSEVTYWAISESASSCHWVPKFLWFLSSYHFWFYFEPFTMLNVSLSFSGKFQTNFHSSCFKWFKPSNF